MCRSLDNLIIDKDILILFIAILCNIKKVMTTRKAKGFCKHQTDVEAQYEI